MGGWVGVEWVGGGGTGAVMGLPKAFTGSIITARDSANGVLTYTEIQNSYSEINNIRLKCFSLLLQMCLRCQLSVVLFKGVKGHVRADTFENTVFVSKVFCIFKLPSHQTNV